MCDIETHKTFYSIVHSEQWISLPFQVGWSMIVSTSLIRTDFCLLPSLERLSVWSCSLRLVPFNLFLTTSSLQLQRTLDQFLCVYLSHESQYLTHFEFQGEFYTHTPVFVMYSLFFNWFNYFVLVLILFHFFLLKYL